jgi:hypothetical protein
LLEYLSAEQLLGWQIYAAKVGLARRDDIHWGMLMALLFNIHRGKNVSPKDPSDFMPYTDKLDEEISEEELGGKIFGSIRMLKGGS